MFCKSIYYMSDDFTLSSEKLKITYIIQCWHLNNDENTTVASHLY